jgi:hypothetical protein
MAMEHVYKMKYKGGSYMATISSKDRKALPNEIFGLPEDRKFPLTDEAHVRKAIQYFKFAPPAKRVVLAKNINARAKELGMRLKISKMNDFYKFADKLIVRESAYDDYEFQRLVEIGQGDVEKLIGLVNGSMQQGISQLFNKLFVNPSLEVFITIEKELQPQILSYDAFKHVYDKMGINHYINPIKHVNEAMQKSYDLLFGFLQYNDPLLDLTNNNLINCVLEDIFHCIDYQIQLYRDTEIIKHKLKLMTEVVAYCKCNIYYVVRKLKQIQVDAQIAILIGGQDFDDPRRQNADNNLKLINETLNTMLQINEVYDPSIISDVKVLDVLYAGNMNWTNSVDYLKVLKNEIKSHIDIILLDDQMHISGTDQTRSIDFLTNGIVAFHHREIIDCLTYLEGSIRKENVKYYNRNYSLDLCSSDIVAFTELDAFQRLYVGKDANGDDVYYGICRNKLYLLGKTNVPGELVLIRLYENCETLLLQNLVVRDYADFNKADKMSAIKVMLIPQNDLQGVTEGITIDKDGGVKFSFKPKKSYMDEYAENHKVLMQNVKAKNIDALKDDLCAMFALINDIERNILYGKKHVKAEIKKDAEKARAFATNDFKTYLKVVQKADKSFNFMKYYEESDFGKIHIGFKKDEIIGLKRLFQTLILK